MIFQTWRYFYSKREWICPELGVGRRFNQLQTTNLHVRYIFTICSLYFHYIFTRCLLLTICRVAGDFQELLLVVSIYSYPWGITLPATDGEVPPESLRLHPVRKFSLKMYHWFRNSFSFRAFFKHCLRKILPRYQHGLSKKHDIVYYLVDFYCFKGKVLSNMNWFNQSC